MVIVTVLAAMSLHLWVRKAFFLRDGQPKFLSCSKAVLSVITFERYPTLALSVQTRFSALGL